MIDLSYSARVTEELARKDDRIRELEQDLRACEHELEAEVRAEKLARQGLGTMLEAAEAKVARVEAAVVEIKAHNELYGEAVSIGFAIDVLEAALRERE